MQLEPPTISNTMIPPVKDPHKEALKTGARNGLIFVVSAAITYALTQVQLLPYEWQAVTTLLLGIFASYVDTQRHVAGKTTIPF